MRGWRPYSDIKGLDLTETSLHLHIRSRPCRRHSIVPDSHRSGSCFVEGLDLQLCMPPRLLSASFVECTKYTLIPTPSRSDLAALERIGR
jgi:hypothetical protein